MDQTTSSASPREPGLDTLRALAIFAVMVFHFRQLLPEGIERIGRFGWIGVDLFFVLSGYLIGVQLLKPCATGNRPSLSEFYRRRGFRILPSYLFVLALYFTFPPWREAAGIAPLWQFLTFTENLWGDYPGHQAFSHVWSLCVEEHFYALFPVLVLGMVRKPSFVRTALIVALVVGLGMCIRAFLLVHELRPTAKADDGVLYLEHIYYPTYTRMDGLVMGVVLALVKIYWPRWWAAAAQKGHSALFAGLLLIALALWLFRDRFAVTNAGAWGTVVGFPLLSLGLGMVVASSVSKNGLLSRFRVPGAELLASLAYSLYLTHKEVVHLDRVLLPSLTAGRGAEAMLVYGASCFAAAGLLYLSIERPFMLLRERSAGRRVSKRAGDLDAPVSCRK